MSRQRRVLRPAAAAFARACRWRRTARLQLQQHLAPALLFAVAFGDPDADPMFDLDGSGLVDFQDFFIVADAFGTESSSISTAMGCSIWSSVA